MGVDRKAKATDKAVFLSFLVDADDKFVRP